MIETAGRAGPAEEASVIDFKCTNCGQSLEVDDGNAGKKTKCDNCGTVLEIPWPELLPHIRCPHCGAEPDFPLSKAGYVEPCPKCGGLIHLPGTAADGKGCSFLTGLVSVMLGTLAWWTLGR